MNLKEILVSVGDLSLNQLLMCQVANSYFKSADYKKNKAGITYDVLKIKDSYIKEMSIVKAKFLFESLKSVGVLTQDGHPTDKFNIVISKCGLKGGVPLVRQSNKPALERQQDFYNEVMSYKSEYPSKMLNEFYNYWGAIDRVKQTMRFEDQLYFETGKRLSTRLTWLKQNGSGSGNVLDQAI